MIILITGASHAGKTLLAQKLLEKYSYPYLSIDHLKMDDGQLVVCMTYKLYERLLERKEQVTSL